ncbi:MAG TPA: TRIC cation channel family protein [Gemmatimonadaceae bacterium]|nr:TRIC cation channel family protein [Gemmatimonadaceae bacterium]
MTPAPAQFTIAVEVGAVLVSALSGMIVASQKRLDLVGTSSLALVTAFGGGTLRDILLDRRPFFWDTRWEYVPVIVVLSLAFGYSTRFHRMARAWAGRMVLVDALGLALFSLTGLAYALEARMSLFVAVLIGVLAGTGGGVVRDVLVNETPFLFLPGELYATASFLGCWVAVGIAAAGAGQAAAGVAGFVSIVALRMLSVRTGVRVPAPLWERQREGGGPPR